VRCGAPECLRIACAGQGLGDVIEPDSPAEITRLLHDWSSGNPAALAALYPLVYDQLRAIAQKQLRRERSAHTLQRTALVHEAFLRMVDQKNVNWRSRAQFFGLASQMMRRILVDYARRRRAAKRGQRVAIDIDVVLAADETGRADQGDAGSLAQETAR
jgi:RNA polymerase sigma factor (TIGR02999 family)